MVDPDRNGAKELLEEQRGLGTKAGEACHAPHENTHGAKVSAAAPAELLAGHAVDKGKPLTESSKIGGTIVSFIEGRFKNEGRPRKLCGGELARGRWPLPDRGK
jgi:hypothetical protein